MEFVLPFFLSVQRLYFLSTEKGHSSNSSHGKVQSEPVDGCFWLPLLQLFSVAVGAVVARFRVSIVGAVGCPTAARLQAGQTPGTAQWVVSDWGLPAPRVYIGAHVPEAIVVTPTSWFRSRVVRWVKLRGVWGREAWGAQGGGALWVIILGMGGSLHCGAVPGEGGVRG